MLKKYKQHVAERANLGLPPLALDTDQTEQLVKLLSDPSSTEVQMLVDLLTHRIPSGVDPAAKIKAAYLASIASAEVQSKCINRIHATELLATMLGGYNIAPLASLLEDKDPTVASAAAQGLAKTLLVFDAFLDLIENAKQNKWAKVVIDAWKNADWFLERKEVPESITVSVFKVDGEINTDDLSPGTEAWSRPDIPLHAQSMLKSKIPDALAQIEKLKKLGHVVAFVGDVVGTGSSRKSAINSVLWHLGQDIPYVPNKRYGGVILGGKIAPIFFNTAEDSGALPIECDVSNLNTGDIIKIFPSQGVITDTAGKQMSEFKLRPVTMLDEVRAGGRIHLIIGRSLTDKTRNALGLEPSDVFIRPDSPQIDGKGFTLAQKIVGRACGIQGVRPGVYCEPRMTTVGSQDTTGAMTRDELKELACLGFSADLVMQSFCHTVAYPRPIDVQLQNELPQFMQARGGVSLRPGDGIIHSWLNRMLLPDTVGTGGDSHTRFPIGISFPAGSGLVAFAAAMGVMPLNMPDSVLVKFVGEMQPGVTLRDLVNAIPYVAAQQGLLTVFKKNKKNAFSGRIMEIEGLPHLKVEQAFELADATAERSANGCTIRLNKEPVIEYLNSNITLLNWLIREGYEDKRTLQRRIVEMQSWLDNPTLLEPDNNAEYSEILTIDLNTLTEPLLACPNDPDYIKPLSEVASIPVDEVFIGSCMTNIGHYRAAGSILEDVEKVPLRLWIVPPTKMDVSQLTKEGVYTVFEKIGSRIEVPGCSLCMGNQARVADGATVVSTSTRNYPNRMGKGANVYLSSAELAAVTAKYGRIPTHEEYLLSLKKLDKNSSNIYRYLNFDQIKEYSN